MKRLTWQNYDMCQFCGEGSCCEHYCDNTFPVCDDKAIYDRLSAIEDILGDEYDLEEIKKVIQCKNCVNMWAVSALPGECYCRLRGEVVPRDGYCHRGRAALKAREQE